MCSSSELASPSGGDLFRCGIQNIGPVGKRYTVPLARVNWRLNSAQVHPCTVRCGVHCIISVMTDQTLICKNLLFQLLYPLHCPTRNR